MNNGIGSSNFIMTVLGLLVTVLLQFWGKINPQITAIAVILLPIVYISARTIIKSTASTKDDLEFNSALEKLRPMFDKLGVKTELIDIPVAAKTDTVSTTTTTVTTPK